MNSKLKALIAATALTLGVCVYIGATTETKADYTSDYSNTYTDKDNDRELSLSEYTTFVAPQLRQAGYDVPPYAATSELAETLCDFAADMTDGELYAEYTVRAGIASGYSQDEAIFITTALTVVTCQDIVKQLITS